MPAYTRPENDVGYGPVVRVYAIADVLRLVVKVGKTTGDPHKRLSGLQVACASKLTLLAWTVDVTESEAHSRVGSLTTRLSGEWFVLCGGVVEELATWTWSDPVVLGWVRRVIHSELPPARA